MKIKKLLLIVTSVFSINSYAYDARSYILLPTDYSLVDSQISTIETNKKINQSINAESKIDMVYFRYLKYFKFFDNFAAAYILLPYGNNDANLHMGSKILSENNSGLGDVKLFLGVGIYNMPSLTKEQFKTYNTNGVKSACSVALTLPTGQYDKNKLFNMGLNQTTVKPECIVTYTDNKFVAEFATGLTHYTDNKEYFNNSTLSKKEVYHSELHLSYNIQPKFWGGVILFYQKGGQTSVNNIEGKDKQDNLSAGLIFSYNIVPGNYIKLNYQKTISSPEFAPRQDYLGLAYQKLF